VALNKRMDRKVEVRIDTTGELEERTRRSGGVGDEH
jgi:hypothetical protein